MGDDHDMMERRYEARQAGIVEKEDAATKKQESTSKRLPVVGDDGELMEVDVDSDEEREQSALREKRAEEKNERLRQAAREKREKRKANIRAAKGLTKKEEGSKQARDDGEYERDTYSDGASDSDSDDSLEIVSDEEGMEVDEMSSSEPNGSSTKADKGKTKKAEEEEDDDDMLELKMFVKRQQEVTAMKEKIAKLATSVLEDPEKNMKKLRELHELMEYDDVTVRKLVIISELKIFNDIIPSYRIVTGADVGVNLSKDVKKLREFESAILDCYQAYLTTLGDLIYQTREILKAIGEQQGQQRAGEGQQRHQKKKIFKSYGKWKASTVDISGMTPQGIEALLGLGRVAAKAMGELLIQHHHFNFRANLIMALVPVLNTSDVELSKIISDSFRRLFQSDGKGASSLEVARTISQLVKKKEFYVRPIVVEVLKSLRLRKPLEEGDSIFSVGKPGGAGKEKKKHMSRKEQKDAKKDKVVEKELKETEAVESKQDRDLIQTETLKVVFLLYFKILKNTKRSPLLPVVLEAMAHFSHLINLELLLNLVEVLKDVIADKLIPLESSMHTVITAFQAIKLQGDSLTVDLKDFYTHFYPLLEPSMASPSRYSILLPLVIRSLELMILHRRVLALDRVAAYAKRILTLSLHLPPQCVLAVLIVLNLIYRKYPKTQQMLDTEISGMGHYMPEVADPEHCNAFAATAWEFSLLTEHVHPSVTNLAKMILNQDPITETNAMKIFHQFDFVHNGIVPSMSAPRPHVFVKALAKAQKAGRDNIYFVQPSSLYPTSDFAKSLQASKSLTERKLQSSSTKQLFKAHWDDLHSFMDIGDQDDDIISSDDEE